MVIQLEEVGCCVVQIVGQQTVCQLLCTVSEMCWHGRVLYSCWLAGEIRVRPYVADERALLPELHMAVGARVRLVAGMYFFVIGQLTMLA